MWDDLYREKYHGSFWGRLRYLFDYTIFGQIVTLIVGVFLLVPIYWLFVRWFQWWR